MKNETVGLGMSDRQHGVLLCLQWERREVGKRIKEVIKFCLSYVKFELIAKRAQRHIGERGRSFSRGTEKG